MKMDEKIAAVEELIRRRREIDEQLETFFAGETASRKQRVCSSCGKPGHQSRNCPRKMGAAETPTMS